MTLAAVIVPAIKVSLALTVFGFGLRAVPRDLVYLAHHRGLATRSFVAMSVVMPLVALWIAVMFDLVPAVKVALIALSLSPVPPFLPGKIAKAGGEQSYAIGLLTMSCLAAIITVPVSVLLLGGLFGVPFHIRPATIAGIVLTSVLIPLLAGAIVNHFAPARAEKLVKPISVIATIVLVAALLPILVTSWATIRSLFGNGTLVAIIALAAVGLAAGHMLGGPNETDRTVLGLSTATRHPAVALAIVTATFPNEKLVFPAVLLDMIVCAIACAPYVQWRKRGVRAGSYDLSSSSYAGRRAAPQPYAGPLRRLTDRRR